METNNYSSLFMRNTGIVTDKEQEKLRKVHVTVFGLGGLGGVICEIFARSGICNFNLIDKDVFDVSNVNRQIYAKSDTIGELKTKATRTNLLLINPEIKTKLFEKVDENNIDEILDGTDIAILALDETVPCIIISRETRKRNIPLVEGWALPYGNVRVFTKDTPSLEEVYNLTSLKVKELSELSALSAAEKKQLNHQMLFELKKIDGITDYYTPIATDRAKQGNIPSFAPMVWLTACIMAFEAIKVLLNKDDVALSPTMQTFNPFNFTGKGYN